MLAPKSATLLNVIVPFAACWIRRARHVDPGIGRTGGAVDVDRYRALGQPGQRGAGRRVGDAAVARPVGADAVNVALVIRARVLVFAGEGELAAVRPPDEIVRRI